MPLRCAIVGGGASGIVSARWADAYGVEPVIFEASDEIGGLWRYKETVDEYSSAMKTTTLNTSKEVTAFSDFPAPADFPNYMRNDQFWEYFRLYALHHDLYKHVRFGHTVLQIKRAFDYCESGRWTVQFKDPNGNVTEEDFDCVVLAIGHNSVPNFPTGDEEWWPHQNRFKGQIMHSKQYKHGGGFEDKICVVVGSGNSAVDVASDLSRVAKKVYLSLRKGAYVIGRLGDRGRPIDLNLLTRFRTYFINRYTPKWLLVRQMKHLLQSRFDHALYGLVPEESVLTSQVSLSDDLPSRIMTGTVIVKPAIKEFTPTGIVLSDGTTTEHVDAVVCATGYTMRFKLVEEGCRVPVEGNFARLYKNIFPVDDACLQHNTLGFVGLAQVFGSSIALSEMQARYFFHQLRSRTKERPRGLLPPEKEMCDEVDARRQRLGAKVDRKPFWLDFIPYMDSLADVIGCRPNLFKLALKDPMLAWSVTFGPNSTYVYRLHGPHKWHGARDAVLGVEKRVCRPFITRSSQTKPDSSVSPYLMVPFLVLPVLSFVVLTFW